MQALHKTFYLVSIATGFLCSSASFAAEETQKPDAATVAEEKLAVNNDWKVELRGQPQLRNVVYATLRKVNDHWEIESLSDKKVDVLKSSGLELFAVNTSLSQWTNVENDMVRGCASFKTKYYSVCNSSLADNKTALTAVGVLFGGSGSIMTGYIDEKVKAAINSIPPEQASSKMKAFLEEYAQNQRKIAEQKATAEEEKKAALAKLQAEAKQARAAARIGARDWCEQEVIYFDYIPGTLARPMQISQAYKCFTFGTVDEGILRAEGWTITAKQPKTVGTPPQLITVHDIGIEKIR